MGGSQDKFFLGIPTMSDSWDKILSLDYTYDKI